MLYKCYLPAIFELYINRFVVITLKETNALGIAITVPVTSGGDFARSMGITVSIIGYNTTRVAVCNQVRSFDIEARIKSGSAKYIEQLDEVTTADIVNRVLSTIEPAEG